MKSEKREIMYRIQCGDLFGFILNLTGWTFFHPHRVGIHSTTCLGGFSRHRLHELIFAAGDGEGEEARWVKGTFAVEEGTVVVVVDYNKLTI